MNRWQTRFRLRKIGRMLRAGFDLFLPARCMGCGSLGAVWCDACESRRKKPVGTSCPVCGIPRVFRFCPACSQGIKDFKVACIAAYQPPLREALVAFKYRPELTFAELLGQWVEQKLCELAWDVEVVVPVPLSKVRFRQRGYNQVELITSWLTRSSTRLHGNSSIQRVRDTRSQVGLDPPARYGNMEKAFTAQPAFVQGRAVLLVDDLLTSGATMIACAQALFATGADKVYAIAVARA